MEVGVVQKMIAMAASSFIVVALMLPFVTESYSNGALSLGSRGSGFRRSTLLRSSPAATAPMEVANNGGVVSESNPLKVIVAGAGVGGLVFASSVRKCSEIDVGVVEKASKFKRFGGPIQLASNALQVLKEMDGDDGNIYDEIMSVFTNTGDKTNGIKDGIRDDWYAKFDLKTPAESRNMPFTCVVERPELQEILMRRTGEHIRNGAGVTSYHTAADGGVTAVLESGEEV